MYLYIRDLKRRICYFFDIIDPRNKKFENPSPDVFMVAGGLGEEGIPKILKWAVFRKSIFVVKRVKGN